jgi:hypothetical protein
MRNDARQLIACGKRLDKIHVFQAPARPDIRGKALRAKMDAGSFQRE